MSEDVKEQEKEPRYILLPDMKDVNFILQRGKFKGMNVKIKSPIEYVDPETKDELLLDIRYGKKGFRNISEEEVHEEAAQCFLDIYSGAVNKKALDYVNKMKTEGKNPIM